MMDSKEPKRPYSRRSFLSVGGAAVVGATLPFPATPKKISKDEPIIDIHQHTNYVGRTNAQLLTHQQAMGITHTILLPSGRMLLELIYTNYGESNGLEAQVEPNKAAYKLARKYPEHFYFGANEVPGIPQTISTIEKYLKKGAVVIGEQKFNIDSASLEMQRIYQLAEEYDVPILMHWQHGRFNHGLECFHKILEKYPRVNFIGHAQTWWGNIDKEHNDQTVMYPKGPVTPGGITDRLLSDYPNMFADLSAGSGLNSMTRDEDHAKNFLERHQDKILYGSDCADKDGLEHDSCQGYKTIQTVKELSGSKAIERKILYENAKKLFRI